MNDNQHPFDNPNYPPGFLGWCRACFDIFVIFAGAAALIWFFGYLIFDVFNISIEPSEVTLPSLPDSWSWDLGPFIIHFGE